MNTDMKRDASPRRAAESDLRRRLQQLTAMYRMTAALGRAVNVDDIFREGLDCVCDALGAHRAALLLRDEDGVMRFTAWRNLSAAYRTAVEGHSPWAPDEPQPEPVVIEDAATDESAAAYREALQRERIAALTFVPLVYQTRLLGKFMLYFDRPFRPTPEDLLLAEGIAGHVAFAIARNRSSRDLARRERELETLAEHSPDLIVRFDTALRHLYVNRAVESVTGVAPSAFIGRTMDELAERAALFSGWRHVIERVLETGRAEDLELRFETPAGPRHFLTTVTPELVEDGAVRTVLTTTRDVTELKRAESRQRLLAETGAVMAMHLDHRDGLRAVARLVLDEFATGCAIDLAREDGSLERLVEESRVERGDALESLSRDPDAADGMAGHVTAYRSGRACLYASTADDLLRAVIHAPLVARGRTIGVITLVSREPAPAFSEQDLAFAEQLAGHVALAVDNLRLYEQSLVANRTRSLFMATMSHELRTPLNAIMGYAELLDMQISGPLTDRQATKLERIRASTRHLLDVIEGILTFSAAEAGSDDCCVEDVDAARLAGEAIAMLEPAALRRGLAFDAHLPDGPLPLRSDPVKLRQVLLNLIGNAVKFTDSGSIDVALDADDDAVTFEVRDTGIGIAAEHLERIFDPFWQVESGATRRAGGTGLGLAVSRHLAGLLGGELAVESEPGHGSRFALRVPRDSSAAGGGGEPGVSDELDVSDERGVSDASSTRDSR
jgi:PAS domain S-box-containing protein